MGGMFGAIGVLASLQQRARTGQGQQVASALFENNVFLVAQHMLQYAVTGKPANPMPNRISAWGVYDVFTVKDGEQIFLAAVSDTQWAILCEEFGFDDLKSDPRLGSNNDRVRVRSWLTAELRKRFADFSAAELSQRFEKTALPYAPITRPHDLFNDPHLLATGGLAPMTVAADNTGAGREIDTRVALLPIALKGERLRVRKASPKIGADTIEILKSAGYTQQEIEELHQAGVIGTQPEIEPEAR
jgi:crotonobetainyl-CoA:carnitine CoA-transferase CaiB-like acyl-CoA transferase